MSKSTAPIFEFNIDFLSTWIGLKDLADFLPASLATIVSYFSAEVSRGFWKPAFMNGMDWPSPAANLSNVEEHMKKILAATGIDIPSLAAGESSPLLWWNFRGVGALLGYGFGSHFCGGISLVAPGILYLRVYRSIRDILFITEEIISLLMHSVREIAFSGLPQEKMEKLKTSSKNGMRYRQVSLAAAMTRVKLAAFLGASLVWLSGGLGSVHLLIKETLPSWFISVHRYEHDGLVSMLGGNALAYFAVLCGAFAWGVDSSSSASKRRPKIPGFHMEFLASALDGKISLGCDWPTWRAYVSGFVSLMVSCTPTWVLEVDVEVLKRLSRGLKRWNEEEIALALLGIGGVGTMGAAAELIIERES